MKFFRCHPLEILLQTCLERQTYKVKWNLIEVVKALLDYFHPRYFTSHNWSEKREVKWNTLSPILWKSSVSLSSHSSSLDRKREERRRHLHSSSLATISSLHLLFDLSIARSIPGFALFRSPGMILTFPFSCLFSSFFPFMLYPCSCFLIFERRFLFLSTPSNELVPTKTIFISVEILILRWILFGFVYELHRATESF